MPAKRQSAKSPSGSAVCKPPHGRRRDLERRALTALDTLEGAIGYNEQLRTRVLSLFEPGERDQLRRQLARLDEQAEALHRRHGWAVWRLFLARTSYPR